APPPGRGAGVPLRSPLVLPFALSFDLHRRPKIPFGAPGARPRPGPRVRTGPCRVGRRGRKRAGAGGAGQGEGDAMKITGLQTFVVSVSETGGGNWVFVKVHTDQDGLTGLGEGSVTSKAQTIKAAVEEHERFLVGRDPMAIEWLWQAMYRYPRWRGGPVLNS